MPCFTGELSDNHDILSMKFYELESDSPGPEGDRSKLIPSSSVFESPRDHVDDPKPSSMSGVKLFFLLLLGVLGCFACVVIGIMIYQKQQENSRKRFYWNKFKQLIRVHVKCQKNLSCVYMTVKKGTKTIHYHRAFQEQSLTKKSLDSKVNSPNCKKWIQIIQFQGKSRAVNIINNKQ